jgi:hypothetical protein
LSNPTQCPTSTRFSPPPHPPRPRPSATNLSQHKPRHTSDAPHTMRLVVRHEQCRLSDKPLALFKEGQHHHAFRLRHFLDAQPDVLDALNAMTEIHIDTSVECIQIMYDLYMDALNFSHRGKTMAPASHPQYHCYYLVFKDLEEIINRQYSKAQRQHEKMKKLCCPYYEVPIDYFRSPPPLYNPPPRPRSRSPSKNPSFPAYSPTAKSSSLSSSTDGIPSLPPPRIVRSRTHVALLNETEDRGRRSSTTTLGHPEDYQMYPFSKRRHPETRTFLNYASYDGGSMKRHHKLT